MTWADIFDYEGVRIASRELLLAHGATGALLTAAVRNGHLIRARRDRYLLPTDTRDLLNAVRVGGRLDCVSALADSGVFAFQTDATHIRLNHEMSRMRHPRSRFTALSDHNRGDLHLHWWPPLRELHPLQSSVSLEDALIASSRCQHPWHALGSLENALHLKLLSESAVDRVFAHAPMRFQTLRTLVNGLAESGQETYLRMIAVNAGLNVEVQATFPQVGRVDMIVEGCLALEADSRLAHDGWERHVADRHRDLALADLGYASLRPAYQHTMFEPALVGRAILNLLAQNVHYRTTFV